MADNELLNEELSEEDFTVTLVTDQGEEVDFNVIASISLEEKLYFIMQPVELIEDMTEEDALVFEVSPVNDEEDKFDIVTDDKIIDAVFAEYDKLLAEDEE
ncbi:MAG: DUF1292 domain-containing protein [Clostridia bacterium]|nr:DUF1292 domain-containing protein [Clostridia bacterium]